RGRSGVLLRAQRRRTAAVSSPRPPPERAPPPYARASSRARRATDAVGVSPTARPAATRSRRATRGRHPSALCRRFGEQRTHVEAGRRKPVVVWRKPISPNERTRTLMEDVGRFDDRGPGASFDAPRYADHFTHASSAF